MKGNLFKFSALLALLFIVSCERRPLFYESYSFSNIRIEVDWSNSLTGEEKPLGVSAWFYPKDDSKPLEFLSNDVDGFTVEVPVGEYDILVFNREHTEFKNIGFRDLEQLELTEIYSYQATAAAWYSKADDEKVVNEPDKVALAIYRDFVVTEEMVKQTELLLTKESAASRAVETIQLSPELQNKNIRVIVHINKIQNLLSARAAISGMAEGVRVNLGKANFNDVTYILSKWSRDKTNGSASLFFDSGNFGLVGDSAGSSTGGKYDYWTGHLRLELLLVDNKTTLEYEIPLSGALVSEDEDEINLTITIDPKSPEITLPDVDPEGTTSGGFDAVITEWEKEVETPIYID